MTITPAAFVLGLFSVSLLACAGAAAPDDTSASNDALSAAAEESGYHPAGLFFWSQGTDDASLRQGLQQALAPQDAHPKCGATLIAPDVVLTSRTCVSNVPRGAKTGAVLFGSASAANPVIYATTASYVSHNPDSVGTALTPPDPTRFEKNSDWAVVRLSAPVADLSPATVNADDNDDAALTADLQGNGVVFVGYAYDANHQKLVRRSSSVTVHNVNGNAIWATIDDSSVCGADFGGALMYDRRGLSGAHGAVVVGVLNAFDSYSFSSEHPAAQKDCGHEVVFLNTTAVKDDIALTMSNVLPK